ncbi:MAG: RHS repeat-associated core domain-containing protein [Pyrinomonadaceae bacterium]|nr:RHS repeat-associated core domain-containing protein [Pyrinomonadaceae bacterium]
MNRVTQRGYSDSTPAVSYFYDNLTNAKGRLTKVASSVSTTEYTSFDILGRVTGHKQTTDGQEYATGYVYNLSGALVEQTYPSGRVVKNVIDNNGDLEIVQSKKNAAAGYWNYAKNFTYTAAGAVTSMQLGNGRWESTEFNSRLQPTQIALGATPNATNLLKLDYEYGASDSVNNGNITKQTITVPTVGSNNGFVATQTYSYDSLNRLKQATENITPNGGSATQSWKQTFTFDRYGNRRFDLANGNTTFPDPNCPEAVCNPTISTINNRLTSTGWQYDNAGNTTQDAEGRQFTYDAENKQVKVKDPQNQTIGQYFYDGDGKRVKKIVPATGEVTVFVYNASGQVVSEYSTVISQTPKVSYTTSDHLGSPRILTDENGSVISRRDLHPFGEETFTPHRVQGLGYQPDDVRQKFTGYERDIESELDFAQARYYNSQHGRFTSPDDFLNDTRREDPASWNLYAYVRNNPLNATDPSGEILQLLQTTDKDGKVINQINDKDRAALLGWLNHIYGCQSCVTINKNNQLQVDTSGLSKDVLAATKDLTDAINDKNHIAAVVGYEGNSDVNFAKAISGDDMKTPLMIGGQKADAVLIDFKDFRGLSGDKAAVSAFENYAFVHEVFHLFPRLAKDTVSDKDVTGPVENRVNEIRQVRGDLLRATYNAESDTGIWGSMYFGPAKIDKKTGLPKRNVNNGLVAESQKRVLWNLRMTGN